MKTKLVFLFFCSSFICFAQNGINYKAVIKDDNGNVVANDLIVIQFTILDGATNVYVETHTPITDDNGTIIINIGEGIPISGTFSTIDWSSMNHFLNVMVNTGGGLQNMGTTAFKTVPYALSTADAVFIKNGNDAYKETGNIGIGTSNPTTVLHINDAIDASILLQTPSYNNLSSLRLENGNVAGAHTFFKLENQNDALHIGVDSDLTAGTGYADAVIISTNGSIITQGSMTLANGTAINEFSTDITLAGNSNSAVPTEQAVKTYVDAKSSIFTESTVSLIFGGSQTIATTSFVTIQATSVSSLTITNNTNFITVHVDVDGTITKFYMTNATAPIVVPYPGSEGSSLRIKVFSFSAAGVLFFDGMKLTGNHIVGLLRVND